MAGMRRALLAVRLAFEAIIGILILFNVGTHILFNGLRSVVTGPPGTVIGTVIGILIGIAFVVDAKRVSRHLKVLDAKVSEPE